MLSKEEMKRISNMTPEERKADLLDGIGDTVRHEAKHLAMIKAIAYRESGVAPEDFDAVLEKELKKAWDKVKDKDSLELAIMGMLELASNGADIKELLGGVK